MNNRNVHILKVLRAKLAAAKEPGASKDYQLIKLNKADLTHLEAFLKQLNDVDDISFRELILKAQVLDASRN
jgi:hypothetical protein